MNCNQAVAFIRLRPDIIDLKYACHACQAKIGHLLRLQKIGTIGNLNLEQVREFSIPLPPLKEQKRVSSLLQQSERLLRTRRYVQELSDKFLQAVFDEMFGDVSKLNVVELGELIVSAKNGLYLPAEKYGSGTPIIRINNFYGGVLNDADGFRTVRATKQEISEFGVTNDDVLINRVNSIEYLGKCALARGLKTDTVYESNMMRVRVNTERIVPMYLTSYLSSESAYRQILVRAKKAVNQASINQLDVESLRIPLPGMEAQQRFVTIVEGTARLRAQQLEANRQAKHLFQTLLHRTFAEAI